MKKFACGCGLPAFAGAAFFTGDDATAFIYLHQKTVAVDPGSLGRVKALFR